jgi:hypothetical protein
VVTAVRISFDAETNTAALPVRNAVLRFSDGTTTAAKLVEFE